MPFTLRSCDSPAHSLSPRASHIITTSFMHGDSLALMAPTYEGRGSGEGDHLNNETEDSKAEDGWVRIYLIDLGYISELHRVS